MTVEALAVTTSQAILRGNPVFQDGVNVKARRNDLL